MKTYSIPALLVAAALCTGLVQAREPVLAAASAAQAGDAVVVARVGKIRVAPASLSAAPAPAPVVSTPPPPMAVGTVLTGAVVCKRGGTVIVRADDQRSGYYHVSVGDKNYHMQAVPTQTGVVRLEDKETGGTWLQMGNKSMLLDQKLGRRVADDCVTASQEAFAASMRPGHLLGN